LTVAYFSDISNPEVFLESNQVSTNNSTKSFFAGLFANVVVYGGVLLVLVIVFMILNSLISASPIPSEVYKTLENAGYENVIVSPGTTSMSICSDSYQLAFGYTGSKGGVTSKGLVCTGIANTPLIKEGATNHTIPRNNTLVLI
jgi:hypothetical protein